MFALLRLLPASDRDKDIEILALRHQITVLQRQLGTTRPRFSADDRAFLASPLHRLPRDVLGLFRLLAQPGTVLRWHRDLLAAAMRPGPGPGTRAVRAPPALSACWCCVWPGRTRPGATGASTANSSSWVSRSLPLPSGRSLAKPASTLHPSAPSITWARFLRSQADALIACDFFETATLTGARLFVLAAIEHASRRIPAPGRNRSTDRVPGSSKPPGTSS